MAKHQRKGVTADIVLPASARRWMLRGDLQYALGMMLSRGEALGLQHGAARSARQVEVQSEKRVTANEEFTDLLRRISSYVEQKRDWCPQRVSICRQTPKLGLRIRMKNRS